MLTDDGIRRTVDAYIAAFDNGDPAAAASIFAENATIEDPVGTPLKRGRDEIAAFYQASMATGAKLSLQGPVRIVVPYAAFAFQVRLHHQGRDLVIDVIDIFRFDDEGKVSEMKAFFGPCNISED